MIKPMNYKQYAYTIVSSSEVNRKNTAFLPRTYNILIGKVGKFSNLNISIGRTGIVEKPPALK